MDSNFWFGVINFSLFVGAMYWLLRRPVRRFFEQRAALLRARVEEASAAERAALDRLRAIQEQVAQSEAELARLQQQIREEGERDRQAIVQRAEEMARKLRLDSERMIAQELRRNKELLRSTTVDLAILMAERMLRERLTTEDHIRLVRNYVQRLASVH